MMTKPGRKMRDLIIEMLNFINLNFNPTLIMYAEMGLDFLHKRQFPVSVMTEYY